MQQQPPPPQAQEQKEVDIDELVQQFETCLKQRIVSIEQMLRGRKPFLEEQVVILKNDTKLHQQTLLKILRYLKQQKPRILLPQH